MYKSISKMIITEIRPRSKRSLYFILKTDESNTVCLHGETIRYYRMKTGDIIQEEDIQHWLAHTEFIRAKQSAMYSLARRAHSEKELAEKLRSKGYSSDTISKTIARLKTLHMINDHDFCQTFISSRMGKKPIGKNKLVMMLKQKGVSAQVIDNAIARFELNASENCLRATEKKLWQLQRETDPKKKTDKLIAHLMRQGFEWNTIQETLKNLKLH